MFTYTALLAAVCAAALCASGADALKHHLSISNDRRSRFFIENFGFEAGGHILLEVTDFAIDGKQYEKGDSVEMAFLVKHTDVDSTAFLEETAATPCVFADERLVDPERDFVVEISAGKRTRQEIVIHAGREGFYNIYFINCRSGGVTFELDLTMYNQLGNTRSYLSAGLAPLPALFGVMDGAYLVAFFVWVCFFLRGRARSVNRVHQLMAVLILLKMLALLFRTIDYHLLQTQGTAGSWGVVYYLVAGAKGLLMFVIIVLIGTGWKFVKPFLSEKDKRVLMIVVPLQLLDNVALIVIEETAPGSQGLFTWKDIFRLVDILCCGAILIPIIWSINHLREASQIDGKAARNLHKLRLFRQFYLMVVSFVYFTRIIVFLMDATLPFRYVWLGDLFTELATLAFFCVTGYMFQPDKDNEYFKLEPEDLVDDDNNGGGGKEMSNAKATSAGKAAQQQKKQAAV